MTAIDYTRFEALTFDCYGTLIDWESGLLAALRALLGPRGSSIPRDALLEAYADAESAAEQPPYRTYREVLSRGGEAIALKHGIALDEASLQAFSRSVAKWPAFPDSPEALRRLKTRFRLGVLTNCDDDLFAASNAKLDAQFDWVVTAQQVRSYKPDVRNFEALLERVALPKDRVLHVAQSLFHDHVPAKRLGLATVWIDRRHAQSGTGATPPARAQPDATFPDLASFARAAVP